MYKNSINVRENDYSTFIFNNLINSLINNLIKVKKIKTYLLFATLTANHTNQQFSLMDKLGCGHRMVVIRPSP
jgi:hypothetical protein